MMRARLARTLAACALILCPVMASAGSLTSAVELCANPMTTGVQKLAALPGAGWTEVATPDADQFALLAGSIGPGFNADMPVAEMTGYLPEIATALANAQSNEILSLFSQGDALLLIGVNLQPGTDLEHLTCLYSGPPTDEMEGYWQTYGGQEVTPLLGREVLLFRGSVSNIPDNIAYSESQVWARVPAALSALTDSYRYERLETAQQ